MPITTSVDSPTPASPLHGMLLNEIQRRIRSGMIAPLYWGPPERITVPVVKCPVCKRSRPDDGTPCKDPVCDTYYLTAIQLQYENHRKDLRESRRREARRQRAFDERAEKLGWTVHSHDDVLDPNPGEKDVFETEEEEE